MSGQRDAAATVAAGSVAVGPVAAAERGADTQVHHFKKSPTLLFDILAEPDKGKQQEKLQRATLSPQELQRQAPAHPQQPKQESTQQNPPQNQQQQHQHQHQHQHQRIPLPSDPVTVPHSQTYQAANQPPPQQHQPPQQNSQDRASSRFLGPETPDIRQHRPTTTDALAGGTAALSEPSSVVYGTSSTSSGVTRLSETTVASCRGASASASASGLEGAQRGSKHNYLPQLPEGRHPQQQAQEQEQCATSGLTAECGRPSSGGVGASTGVGLEGTPATASGASAVPSAPAPAPGAVETVPGAAEVAAVGAASAGPPMDLLSVFTPRVILQELLGELFIAPERLVKQGTFGQGAFATVQSCSLEDPGGGPNLLVAVKSLKPEVLADMDDLRRFLLEANLVRKLKHPNIVSLHGLGAHQLTSLEALRNSAFVVMEALEGGDLRMMLLRQMTGRSPAYSHLDALRWCMHIAAACAYLHEICRPMIIHRDLKPENVMLTGGPTDNRVAKITDFGLHKRARYSRTEDVLIAVTNEWSIRGGSVYRTDGTGGAAPGHADLSVYGGGTFDASYYGGGVFSDAGLLSGPSLHRNADRSSTVHNNRSTSSRYVALAAAGMAAAATTAPAAPAVVSTGGGGSGPINFAEVITTGPGSDWSYGGGSAGRANSAGPNDSLRAGSAAAAELDIPPGQRMPPKPKVTERERPYLLAYDKRQEAVVNASKFSSTNDLVGLHEAAAGAAAAAAALAMPAAAAGTAAAEAAAAQSPFATEAVQRPVEAGEGAAQPGARAAPGPPGPEAAPLSSGPLRNQSQPLGWTPPNVVPPSLEESVHRKMLALIALESAAAAGGTAGAVCGSGAATAAAGGGDGSIRANSGGGADATKEPFSVTEFVRAATALPVDGPTGPSAVMLMRSMSLALQQQRQEEQQQQQEQQHQGQNRQQGGSGGGGSGGGVSLEVLPPVTPTLSALNPALGFPVAPGLSSGMPLPRAARTASTAMKTVPEHNRMSMDLGTAGVAAPKKGTAADGTVNGRRRTAAAVAAAAAVTGGAAATAASRREKAVEAAAKMADATRQVGSLIYMAPELVLSGNYNEKVDVFSFAIIAFELFTGRLLAMKVANEVAYQQMQSSKGPRASAFPPAAAAGPGGGTGLQGASSPVPVAGTRSAEEDAEAGVMAYVMRRSSTGAREAIPGWWPSQLRSLIGRCWAQNPAERPSFSQIHKELRQMLVEGALKDMDSKDPLRNSGCCTIS